MIGVYFLPSLVLVLIEGASKFELLWTMAVWLFHRPLGHATASFLSVAAPGLIHLLIALSAPTLCAILLTPFTRPNLQGMRLPARSVACLPPERIWPVSREVPLSTSRR